jgi:hypothetical protein
MLQILIILFQVLPGMNMYRHVDEKNSGLKSGQVIQDNYPNLRGCGLMVVLVILVIVLLIILL